MRMTEHEVGYMQALSDVQHEVQQMVQDPSTSSEGKLELLGVLSFLTETIDARMLRQGRYGTVVTGNDGFQERSQ